MDISKEKLEWIYTTMYRIRRFEETMLEQTLKGNSMGVAHTSDGQEAPPTGICAHLTDKDWIGSTHRGHGHCISKGLDTSAMMAEVFGKATGQCGGKGGSMHMFDPKNNFYGGHGIVGAQVPLGTGLAFAHSYTEDKGISVVYFGDGAANQGQVYEAFNMAALWKLPVLYIIENNQYGMGTSVKKASAVSDLFRHGESFGIPGMQVDGMDPIAVRDAGIEAATEVRGGKGPLILEMLTYRYRGHSMSDPGKYRTREEIQRTREERDPIERIKSALIFKNIATQDELRDIDSAIRSSINESAEQAQLLPDSLSEELLQNIMIENFGND